MSVADLPTRNLRLVEVKGLEGLSRPWLFVHTIRTAFLVCILLVSIVYQINIGNFLNVEIWLPVYGVLLAFDTVNDQSDRSEDGITSGNRARK